MNEMDDFQAQQDLNILEQATAIENDPKRLSNITEMAKRTLKRAEDVAKGDHAGADAEALRNDGFITRTPTEVGM